MRILSKLLIGAVLLATLPGCFGGGSVQRKVIILESDDTVRRIVDETPVETEYQDPETGEVVSKKTNNAGRYSLSPTSYKKLLKAATENTK